LRDGKGARREISPVGRVHQNVTKRVTKKKRKHELQIVVHRKQIQHYGGVHNAAKILVTHFQKKSAERTNSLDKECSAIKMWAKVVGSGYK
jgi:hypothetical protein